MGVYEGDRGLRSLRAGLAVAGFPISAYLTWTHLSGAAPVCVGRSSGCEAVQTIRYSEVPGVPAATFGLFGYAAMLGCAVLRAEGAAVSGAFLALVGALFGAYLTYLELFVLRVTCRWCVASAMLVVAHLVLGTLCLRLAGSGAPETAGGR